MKTLALAIALVLCGCEKNNPYFCKDHPDNNCLLDGSGGGHACTGPQDCTGDPMKPVCDTGAATPTCVQCTATDHMQCMGTTPLCGSDDTCHGCVMQSDCGANGACLPDGSCGTDTNTAWVAPGGSDTGQCPQLTPCASIEYAVNMTQKPFVKVKGMIADKVTIDRDVTIVADTNATLLEPTGLSGNLLTVTGGNVEIDGLAISGAVGTTSQAVAIPTGSPTLTLRRVNVVGNEGVGIHTDSGTLVMDRCSVTGNHRGGIYLSSTSFDIQNTFVTGNGDNGASPTQFGGVFVVLPVTGSKLEFDTIAKNFAQAGASAGVACASAQSLGNDIIYDNTPIQTDLTMCTLSYSDVGPGTQYIGDHVINTSPAFVDEAAGKFHIMSGSPAAGTGNPAATQPIDIDGDMRPMGAPNRDMGADEVQ